MNSDSDASTTEAVAVSLQTADPRTLLADWANSRDEWTRHIVSLVMGTSRRLSDADIETAYELFLQEKGLRPRTFPPEPSIAAQVSATDREADLALISISEVVGVNAIMSGATIELNAGLTILFGENGTGKTGYVRILKVMADSRTADDILPDIHAASPPTTPSATISYELGGMAHSKEWHGERGEAPFTRMAIFDTPSVNFHVDEDLTYVYTPASLALFNHVTHGIQGVQTVTDQAIRGLKSPLTTLLGRFNRGSSIYPLIETLGAASDLAELKGLADVGENGSETVNNLQLAVAALRADTISQQITIHQHRERVLAEADRYLTSANELAVEDYDTAIKRLADLKGDYATFRHALFTAADLPAPPDDEWELFVRSGQAYRQHLEQLGAHDETRCLFCRQPLTPAATQLLSKYRDYLEDRIAADIAKCEAGLAAVANPILAHQLSDVETFVAEHEDSEHSEELDSLRALTRVATELRSKLTENSAIGTKLLAPLITLSETLSKAHASERAMLNELRKQLANRSEVLTTKEAELRELEARVELNKSWAEIARHVEDAQLADKLTTLAQKFSALLRQLTELSKTASDQLINANFEELFVEESKALRAPSLRLEFVGRQGKAQRRKVITGNYRPSKILSEGEQKVLALADFLSEARLTGISAPIVFDDPVCSLDHRRINEVADRLALLAAGHQVVVFTHDILLVTNLLARFDKSKRCSYFQITDDEGKGEVTRATGPRWDTLAGLKKHVNETIQAAKAAQGEVRAALVRTGYDWLRSWCEVFVECELLAEVTQRYQPNVKMTALSRIKPGALPEAFKTVTTLFNDACRYIDSHSQPLPSLGISPTLAGLEKDWAALKECQKKYQQASK